MALQTAGEIIVDADRETAFAFVSDPVRLARCIPGCSDLHELSAQRYAAVLTSNVAFITLSFKVVVEIVQIEAPDTIEAKISGDAIGLAGHVVATAGLHLAEIDAARTTIRYAVGLRVTGKLGGLGEPVFRAKSAELAREFAVNLKAAIGAQARETHV